MDPVLAVASWELLVAAKKEASAVRLEAEVEAGAAGVLPGIRGAGVVRRAARAVRGEVASDQAADLVADPVVVLGPVADPVLAEDSGPVADPAEDQEADLEEDSAAVASVVALAAAVAVPGFSSKVTNFISKSFMNAN